MAFPVYQPFQNEWLTFGAFFVGIFAVIGLAEFIRKKANWSAEASRKIVHVLVGVMIFWARFLFTSPTPAIVIAMLFILINALALKQQAFQGMHATGRFTLGTVFYPLSFLILVLAFWNRDPAILLISFLILALGDPLAAQVGENVKNPRTFVLWQDQKSLQGSLSLGIAAFIITATGLPILRSLEGLPVPSVQMILLISMAVGVIGALAESMSLAGSDNLTLPLGVALTLDILLRFNATQQWLFFLWLSIAFLFAFSAYRLNVLSLSGTIAAFLLGTFVFAVGGIQWMIPMGTFFVFSSLLSKIGKRKKQVLESVYEKTSNRDMMQVFANGGIGGLMVIVWHYTQMDLFYYAFLGSLAAATADTWATEIGVFSRQQPRHILNFRPVSMGTSGGITTMGTTGAALGSGVLTFSGWVIPIGSIHPFFQGNIFLVIVVSGILGALLDSVLGATVQAQYQCAQCDKITEKTVHCSKPTAQIRGYHWINNDVVNLCCTAAGALLVILFLV